MRKDFTFLLINVKVFFFILKANHCSHLFLFLLLPPRSKIPIFYLEMVSLPMGSKQSLVYQVDIEKDNQIKIHSPLKAR